MKKQDDFNFNGFEPANTTPVPDVLFDELLSYLTGAELKVLLYIIRRTRGFKKETDAISLTQFQKGITTRDGRQLDKGCGIDDRQTIINALASLEKKNCIVSEKGKTPIGDNAVTVYRICFKQVVVGNSNHLVGNAYHGSMENPTTVVDFSDQGSRENHTTVVGNSNPQETVLQDTDSQERVIPEESEGEQSDTATSASSLSLDATLSSSPQSEIENESQQQEIARTCDTCGRPQTQADCLWCMTTRLPAIPKTPSLSPAVEPGRSGGPTPGAPAPLPGGTSHEQNRDAPPPRSVAVEVDSGCTAPAPTPQVPPGVIPPKTIKATVVSPPPQVLVVSQQFTSVEDWKQAQEAFVEQLRGIWKTAAPDFKRQAGNWNSYRKQYLDRWLRANPQPTAESLLSPEERRIWQDWQTNYKGPIPLTASDKQALVMLLPINPTREELKAERGWLFSTDDPKKPWYRKIGVSLLDCAKNWSKWQSLQEPERGEKPMTRTPTREELRRMPV